MEHRNGLLHKFVDGFVGTALDVLFDQLLKLGTKANFHEQYSNSRRTCCRDRAQSTTKPRTSRSSVEGEEAVYPSVVTRKMTALPAPTSRTSRDVGPPAESNDVLRVRLSSVRCRTDSEQSLG